MNRINRIVAAIRGDLTTLRGGDRLDWLAVIYRRRGTPLLGRVANRYLAQNLRSPEERYLVMQRAAYGRAASLDKIQPGEIRGDNVVGSWAAHDGWPDYETYLMRYVPQEPDWIALDFGCGPGRNVRRWSHRFARIDGVDIAQANLDNARKFLSGQIPHSKQPNLFLTSGVDCGDAPHGAYDFVFSTICLQHICVHSIRASIIRSMHECLKPGGRLSIQMGYGIPSPQTVDYYANNIAAETTNRGCDAAIAQPEQPQRDLTEIGFIDFEYWLRPTGPGDLHPQWIFFTAVKPS